MIEIRLPCATLDGLFNEECARCEEARTLAKVEKKNFEREHGINNALVRYTYDGQAVIMHISKPEPDKLDKVDWKAEPR